MSDIPAAAQNESSVQRPLYLWCMDPDALLETPQGTAAAGQLAAGDLLTTNNGAHIQIATVLRIETQPHPEQQARLSWPVRIAADALGRGLPSADLTVPAGTLCLINATDPTPTPVSDLVDGATIQRVQPDMRSWYGIVLQVEASGHALLATSGLVLAGHKLETMQAAEAALMSAATPAVPRLERPFELPSTARHAILRRQLADRALALGFAKVADPDIQLLVGNHALIPHYEGAKCRFDLPASDLLRARGQVMLRSRHAIPEAILGQQDQRRLGVAVAHILADGRRIPLTHWSLGQGWHSPEAGWRWTDGDAAFLVPPRTRTLEIEIANTLLAYPLPQRGGMPVVDEAYG